MSESDVLKLGYQEYPLQPGQALAVQAGRLTLRYSRLLHSFSVSAPVELQHDIESFPEDVQQALRARRPSRALLDVQPGDRVWVGRAMGLTAVHHDGTQGVSSNLDPLLQHALVTDETLMQKHYLVTALSAQSLRVADLGSSAGTAVHYSDY